MTANIFRESTVFQQNPFNQHILGRRVRTKERIMPVYLRKNIVLAPPSISELPEDDADDYLQDPDLLKDLLPQPYRLIDKTVSKLVDDAWEIISSREDRRIAEASKIRPPKYVCGVQLQVSEGVNRCPLNHVLSWHRLWSPLSGL